MFDSSGSIGFGIEEDEEVILRSVAAEGNEAIVLVALVEVGEAGLLGLGDKFAGVHGARAEKQRECEEEEFHGGVLVGDGSVCNKE